MVQLRPASTSVSTAARNSMRASLFKEVGYTLSKLLHEIDMGETAWERMDYSTFLTERRKMMARVIRAGFERLVSSHESE